MSIKRYLDQNVWLRVRHSAQRRHAFESWFRLWNLRPATAQTSIDWEAAARLHEHYLDDAALLAQADIRVPWDETGGASRC
ncbi:MAG: hypothetical protein ACJ760_05355 [Thermoleophilaceae bacterium]